MKAIIPAAGEGKGMLPLTMHIPKVLLPVFGERAIDCAIYEAIQTKVIDEVIVVVRDELLIEYLTHEYKNTPNLQMVLQESPTGMEDAINLARPKDERYAVLLPDVIYKENNILEEMIAQNHAPLIAIAKCPHGIVIPGGFFIEKPYWVVGRYIVEGGFKNPPSHEASDYFIVPPDKLILLESIYMMALGGYNG